MQFTQTPLSANASLLGHSLGPSDGYNDRNASKTQILVDSLPNKQFIQIL